MPQGHHKHCKDVLHASCPFTPSEGVMFSRVFSTPSEGVGLLLGPVMICGSQVPGRDGEMIHLREGTYISGDTYFPR